MRILSGAWPPGMTSASKSFIRAAPAARSDVDDGVAALAAVLAPGRRPDDRDRRAGGAQRLERPGQLAILELVLDEHRDALAGEHADAVMRRFYRLEAKARRSQSQRSQEVLAVSQPGV